MKKGVALQSFGPRPKRHRFKQKHLPTWLCSRMLISILHHLLTHPGRREDRSSLTHGLLQMPPASVHRLSEPSPWPLKSSIMQPWVCPSSSGSPLLLFTLQAPQTHVCHSFLTLILLLKTVLPFLLTIPHHLQIPSHIRALSWFPGQVSLLSYPHTQRRELQSKRHHWD